MADFRYDLFISHATEDKEAVAQPLAIELQRRGFRVWYDEFVLTVGDSLRREIDRGLRESRFGVVILSPSFLAKGWPQYELDSLATREIAEQSKLILPIWYSVDSAMIRSYSLALADKVALKWEDGLISVSNSLTKTVLELTPNDDASKDRRAYRENYAMLFALYLCGQCPGCYGDLVQVEEGRDWSKCKECGWEGIGR